MHFFLGALRVNRNCSYLLSDITYMYKPDFSHLQCKATSEGSGEPAHSDASTEPSLFAYKADERRHG